MTGNRVKKCEKVGGPFQPLQFCGIVKFSRVLDFCVEKQQFLTFARGLPFVIVQLQLILACCWTLSDQLSCISLNAFVEAKAKGAEGPGKHLVEVCLPGGPSVGFNEQLIHFLCFQYLCSKHWIWPQYCSTVLRTLGCTPLIVFSCKAILLLWPKFYCFLKSLQVLNEVQTIYCSPKERTCALCSTEIN